MFTKPFPVRLANDPMHVVLTKRGPSWDEAIQPGRDEDEMILRLLSSDISSGQVSHKTKDEKYKDIWKQRTRGRKDKPRYTEHGQEHDHPERPVHKPIIMQEDEYVRFQGPAPFFVMIIPEPELKQVIVTNPFVDSDPNVPFFGYSAERDSTTGLYFVQKQVRKGDDVVGQLFWEMIFVVLDDGVANFVDPDFFCDR